MKIDFSIMKIGNEYDRPTLARLWGYDGFHGLARGVITPSGANKIILFVTKNKQLSLTQYVDLKTTRELFWEGEKKHGSDIRIIDAQENGDDIFLFYREHHHAQFIYFGLISLSSYTLYENRPSVFIFTIKNKIESQE